MRKVLVVAALLGLAGCGGKANLPSLEPSVAVKEVKVQVPVPCPALTRLGAEPAYPDTDAAIAGAATIGQLARLYAKGRLMRAQRLAEYAAAKASCVF